MGRVQGAFAAYGIEIASDMEKVWDIMTDFEKYSQWNPFIRKVKIIRRINSPDMMIFDLAWFDGKHGKSKEEMISARRLSSDKYELRYRFASAIAKIGLVKAERIQTIEKSGNKVLYYSIEEYHGLLKAFVPVSRVTRGFEQQAEALKKRCEYR